MGLWQWGRQFLVAIALGPCTEGRLKHTPQSSWETGLFLPWCARLQVSYTPRGCTGVLRVGGYYHFTLPLPHDSLPTSPRKELIHQSGAFLLFLWLLPKGPSRSPGLEATRAYACGPTGLCMFAHFKSCCLRFWFPLNLNLGAGWDPPFEHLEVSAQPQ